MRFLLCSMRRLWNQLGDSIYRWHPAVTTTSETRKSALFGVPIAIKEEVDVAGTVTTFGTNANSTKRCKDAEIVSRLRRAGAIIIGKTTMPAFGAFPFTESEATGITRNPYDLSRTPGGSSGGTAAAIAAGMVPAAIGGDGGGSVRIPAAHCGLVGLKPGRGVLPTDPYPDLWLSLGTAGYWVSVCRMFLWFTTPFWGVIPICH